MSPLGNWMGSYSYREDAHPPIQLSLLIKVRFFGVFGLLKGIKQDTLPNKDLWVGRLTGQSHNDKISFTVHMDFPSKIFDQNRKLYFELSENHPPIHYWGTVREHMMFGEWKIFPSKKFEGEEGDWQVSRIGFDGVQNSPNSGPGSAQSKIAATATASKIKSSAADENSTADYEADAEKHLRYICRHSPGRADRLIHFYLKEHNCLRWKAIEYAIKEVETGKITKYQPKIKIANIPERSNPVKK